MATTAASVTGVVFADIFKSDKTTIQFRLQSGGDSSDYPSMDSGFTSTQRHFNVGSLIDFSSRFNSVLIDYKLGVSSLWVPEQSGSSRHPE